MDRKKIMLKGWLILATLMITPMAHAEIVEVDGINYELRSWDHIAYVASKEGGYSGDIVVPATITALGEEYTVWYILSDAFQNASNLTSVVLPETLYPDGIYTFSGCTSLTSVTLPKSARYIGYGMFSGCISLESIYLPDSLRTIDSEAFKDCSALTSIILPDSLQEIGYNAFSGCINLSSVKFPDSLKIIGWQAFAGCTSLREVNVPNTVKRVGDGAFDDTPWFSNQPEGLLYIGSTAYKYIGEIPENTSIDIKEGTVYIGASFNNSPGLVALSIPKTVEYISNITTGCYNLAKITVEEGNPLYDSRDDCNAIIITASNSLLMGCKNTVIPNSVAEISNSAFYGQLGLKTLEIPNSVKIIRVSAFESCSGLESVIFPASVENIEFNAFLNCTGLTSIIVDSKNSFYDSREDSNALIETASNTLILGCRNTVVPAGVSAIGDFAFNGVEGLKAISIPEGCLSIGTAAFQNCSDLENVSIPSSIKSIGSNAFYGTKFLNNMDGDGVIYLADIAYSYRGILPKNLVLKEGTIGIAGNAFFGIWEIETVTIPNSVESIGNSAFEHCGNLKEVVIGHSVKEIGQNAFRNCNNLIKLTVKCPSIPDGTWNNSWFYDLRAVKEVVFGDSVEYIGEYAFCNSSTIEKVTFGKAIIELKPTAFQGCSGLRHLVFNCPTIKAWFGKHREYRNERYVWFDANKNITHVTIGEDVRTLEDYAFSECTNLQSIEILIKDLYVNATVFSGCSGLIEVQWTGRNTHVEGGIFDADDVAYAYLGWPVVKMRDGITTLANNIFKDAKTLNALELSNTIQTLGETDLSGCTNLTTLVLGNEFVRMSARSLMGLPVKSLVSKSATPPSINSYVKQKGRYSDTYGYKLEMKNENAFLIVPDEYLDSYKNHNWSAGGYESFYFSNLCTFMTEPVQINLLSTNVTKAEIEICSINDDTHKDTLSIWGVDIENHELSWNTADGNKGRYISPRLATVALTFETLPAEATSDRKARISARTNGEDDALRFGFEWRRYDAPEEMPSSKVQAPVYNGMIAGTLNNLSPNTYYKYRPYYKSDSGNMYYGDWIAFITADAYVYFEPEVHTFEAQNITESSATLKGYAVAGSDNITEQGFEYWPESATLTRAAEGERMTVTASGTLMEVTLANLLSGTTYRYRTYVKTEKETKYGEEMTFQTSVAAGIESNVIDSPARTVIGYYNLQGKKLDVPQKGMMIIRYSDGTTRKIVSR